VAAEQAAAAAAPAEPEVVTKEITLQLVDDADHAKCLMMIVAGSTAERVAQDISEATGVHPVKLFRKQKVNLVSMGDKARVSGTVFVRGLPFFPRTGLLLGRALALGQMRELHAAYSSREFQRSLRTLVGATAGARPIERSRGLQDLTFREQQRILPRYGFAASREGVGNMVLFYQTFFQQDAEIQGLAGEISGLLSTASIEGQVLAAAEGKPKRWAVVGGSSAGGILVRRTADLHSPEVGRIGTGAVLKELALKGDRLQYEKVSGDGPGTGWVSLSFKGADLVRPV